jgi:predicted nucleic acid-binding protein
MADKCFLDTNGWLALLNSSDQLHRKADELWRAIVGSNYTIVLSDWIIAETGNGLARSSNKHRFVEAVSRLQKSLQVEIVFVDTVLLDRSLTLYDQHQDKSWGLVDCTSFVIMDDMEIAKSFTSDRHFAQAGFSAILAQD